MRETLGKRDLVEGSTMSVQSKYHTLETWKLLKAADSMRCRSMMGAWTARCNSLHASVQQNGEARLNQFLANPRRSHHRSSFGSSRKICNRENFTGRSGIFPKGQLHLTKLERVESEAA